MPFPHASKTAFDTVIPTAKGLIFAVHFKQTAMPNVGAGSVNMNVNEVHEILGHPNADLVRKR